MQVIDTLERDKSYTDPRIWHYSELLKNLIAKDLKLKYRGSILGFLWSLVNPLVTIIVYSLAFTYILKVQVQNFTLFLMSGILPWTFFSGAVMASTLAVTANGNLIKKIHFPRELLPISTVLFNLAQFLLALLVFFPALIFLGARLTMVLVAYPLILLLHVAFTLGLAFVLSAVTVFFQDVKHLTEVGLMMLFWMTPIIYDLSMIPGQAQVYFKLNPLTAYITAYQDIVYWGRWPTTQTWALAALWAVIALGLGWLVFLRYQPSFAEEL